VGVVAGVVVRHPCHLPLGLKKNRHRELKEKDRLPELKEKYLHQEPKVENPEDRKVFHLKKRAFRENKLQVKYLAKAIHAVHAAHGLNKFKPSTCS